MRKPEGQEFRDLILELIRLFTLHTYVEIGVQKGYTFNRIAPRVSRAVAVDIEDMRHILIGQSIEHYRMTSDEFARQWGDPIDMLFIDGDHRKEQVMKDFDSLSPFVREGTGLILLHDTYPVCDRLLQDDCCSNAWEAAWEIRKNRKYEDFEIVTLPGPYAGISIIRKARRHLQWKE